MVLKIGIPNVNNYPHVNLKHELELVWRKAELTATCSIEPEYEEFEAEEEEEPFGEQLEIIEPYEIDAELIWEEEEEDERFGEPLERIEPYEPEPFEIIETYELELLELIESGEPEPYEHEREEYEPYEHELLEIVEPYEPEPYEFDPYDPE